MSQQGLPPFRQYGDPLPPAAGQPVGDRRGRTVLMFLAAVLIGVILGLLLGFWYRDRDDVPVPIPPATTTTTTPSPPDQSAPTTQAPVVSTVPRNGSTTTTGGSRTTVPALPIPPDTANPLSAPIAVGAHVDAVVPGVVSAATGGKAVGSREPFCFPLCAVQAAVE